MSQIRCNLCHGFQDEIPVLQINMGNMESLGINHLVIIEQNIKIKGSWPPADNPLSLRILLQFRGFSGSSVVYQSTRMSPDLVVMGTMGIDCTLPIAAELLPAA